MIRLVMTWFATLLPSPPLRGRGAGGEGANVCQDSKLLSLTLSPSRGEGTGKALLFAILISLSTAGFAFAEPPNVILIMSDDQGYGDLGVHGNPIVRTPNMDAMAEHRPGGSISTSAPFARRREPA